ncbi:MAG: non-canonical purine NTP pyrophosphatase, partial [Oscillospiraceae bacterium]
GGFGYDPIFMVGDTSYSQMTNQQKDKISHRGIALNQLQKHIEKL